MALYDISYRDTLIVRSVRGILEETMGEDYQAQLARRIVLRKDDKVIGHIKKLEEMLNVKILYAE